MSQIDIYKGRTDIAITNKTDINSIPPVTVGGKLTQLAELLRRYILVPYDATAYNNGGYPVESLVIFGNKIYTSLVDANKIVPGTDPTQWELILDSSGGGDSVFDHDLIVQLAPGRTFGKYNSGDTIPAIGKTASQVIEDVLQQLIHPDYVSPTASLSADTDTLQIIGNSIDTLIAITFNQHNGGTETSSVINQDGVAWQHQNQAVYIGLDITAAPIIFQGIVAYAQGPILNNNLGNPDPVGRISAGNTSTNQVIFYGTYPFFATTDDITTPAQQVLLNFLLTTQTILTLIGETSLSNRQTLQIPAGLGNQTINVTKIEYFNTVSQTWDTNNRLTDFTVTDISIPILFGDITPYKQLTYSGPLRGPLQIRITFGLTAGAPTTTTTSTTTSTSTSTTTTTTTTVPGP